MMLKKLFILSFLILFSTLSGWAQKLSAGELNTIDKLIAVKHDLESNNELKTTYKLQIFSGSLEEAEENQQKLESLQLELTSKIIYQTPNYKVWVGSFRNRIQADRAYQKIKSEYPNTLIIRPGK
ncbi:SPOR domain-containing protein [Psychroflexus sp. YR1-1]|uniref:SPOR domain-containing protein n=1 Tax=Psychroflexus aurantiacus TaxID=2709310 RepID=A0A6B3R4R3_9FLAO|nr:SPOR domain-containing protein [Psychroflexus aurantiacus]NEV94550.1 SPOR domain-containing protein [Psychroflexus aurantiacus]